MDGERSTESLRTQWQGTQRFVDGKEERGRGKIAVIGVGEFGGNTIAKLGSFGAKDARTVIVDTDPSKVSQVGADQKIFIRGKSDVGLEPTLCTTTPEMDNTKKSKRSLQDTLEDVDCVFIAAGLGSDVEIALIKLIAEVSRRSSTATIVFTTKSCGAEVGQGHKVTLRLAEIREECDTLVLIDNHKLMKSDAIPSEAQALEISSQIVASVIAELLRAVSASSLINLDYPSFHSVLRSGGIASVGVGESGSPNRATEAVQEALNGALLNTSCREATGAIIHVTGDSQLTVEEANSVRDTIAGLVNSRVSMTWGADVDPTLNGKLRVTLLVTKGSPGEATLNIGLIAPQLFNLEPYSESAERLPVDLDLYQLEADES